MSLPRVIRLVGTHVDSGHRQQLEPDAEDRERPHHPGCYSDGRRYQSRQLCGPLLNRKGEIIGINTAIVTRSGQSAGIGLAIPANNAHKIVDDLIKFGKIQRADLGINAVFETEKGLLVAQLSPKGAAAQAGLRGPQEWAERRNGMIFRGINRLKADLIQSVDGKKVNTLDELLTYVESKKAGDTVVLGVVRDGEKTDVPVELEWGK